MDQQLTPITIVVRIGRISSTSIGGVKIAGITIVNEQGQLGENVQLLEGNFRLGNGFVYAHGSFEVKNCPPEILEDPQVKSLIKDGHCAVIE